MIGIGEQIVFRNDPRQPSSPEVPRGSALSECPADPRNAPNSLQRSAPSRGHPECSHRFGIAPFDPFSQYEVNRSQCAMRGLH